MEQKRRFAALIFLSCAPLAAAAFLLALLLSARSTVGLLRWNTAYLTVIRAVAITGALPSVSLSVFALVTRRRGGKAAAIVGACLSGLAILVFLGMAGGAAFLAVKGSTPPTFSGSLNLLSKETAETWPLQSRYLKFAFSSDAHFGGHGANPLATQAIIETIEAETYDAFFVLGDSVEMGMNDSDLESALAAFSRAERVPLSFLMGNHDALVAAAPRFRKAFGIPAPSYRIDSGGLHILMLDLLWGAEGWSAAKAKRLDAELAAIPGRDAVIVLSHCFFWSSGYTDPGTGKDWFDHPETTREIAPILERHGVDVVISGHNHYMEYLEKERTGYLVVGALGGKPDPEPSHVSPHSVWFARGIHGYAELAFGGEGIAIRFRDRDGRVLFEKEKAVNR